jgi:hypothetical protein
MVIQVHELDLGSLDVNLVAETLVVVVVIAPINVVSPTETLVVSLLDTVGACNEESYAH